MGVDVCAAVVYTHACSYKGIVAIIVIASVINTCTKV